MDSTPASAANELKKLVRHSSHYLTGLVGGLSLGFISFPVFTRAFSVADYGLIDLAQKILLLVTALSKLGLQNSALRFYDGKAFSSDRDAGRRYYSTMFLGISVVAIVVALLFGAVVKLAPHKMLDWRIRAVVSFVMALGALRASESMLYSFLRIEERTKTYSAVTFAIRAAGIAAVCALLPLRGATVPTYFLGILVVEAIAVALLCIRFIKRRLFAPSMFDTLLFRSALAFGLPLVVYETISVILDVGDRFLVQHYLGPEALGRYSVAYGLSRYVNDLLIAPLNLAVVPIYMRLWTSAGYEQTVNFLSTGLDIFLMVCFGVYAGVLATAHSGLIVLASAKYAGTDELMPLIVGGLLLYTSHVFLSAGLLIHKKTMLLTKLVAYSAAVEFVYDWLALPRIGLQAAAIGTFVSYALGIVLIARASFRILPLDLKLRSIARYALSAFCAWFVASRLRLASPLVNTLAAGTLVVVVYFTLLYFLDPRIGRGIRRLPRIWVDSRSQSAPEPALSAVE